MAPDRGRKSRSRQPRPSKPTSSTSSSGRPTSELSSGASHISLFHSLEKQLSQTTDPLLRKQILRKQEQLGGLEAYQRWSVRGGDGTKGGETGKWLVKQLFELEGRKEVRLFIRPASISMRR